MIDSIGTGASNSTTTSNSANNEAILTAFEAKRRAETCPACDPEPSTLEIEAAAAVREVSFAVQNISVSEILPRTTELMFLNLTTKEGSSYCIELTTKGWRIASNRNDCMNGDFLQIDTHTRYFMTIYQLLDHISPEYRNLFGQSLINKLTQLEAP